MANIRNTRGEKYGDEYVPLCGWDSGSSIPGRCNLSVDADITQNNLYFCNEKRGDEEIGQRMLKEFS
jgi:hypothetical protein